MSTATRTDENQQVNAERRSSCNHFWTIETAGGRISSGVCRRCGAIKEFRNYLPDCVQGGEEEYQNWLSKQRNYEKSTKSEGVKVRNREHE